MISTSPATCSANNASVLEPIVRSSVGDENESLFTLKVCPSGLKMAGVPENESLFTLKVCPSGLKLAGVLVLIDPRAGCELGAFSV